MIIFKQDKTSEWCYFFIGNLILILLFLLGEFNQSLWFTLIGIILINVGFYIYHNYSATPISIAVDRNNKLLTINYKKEQKIFNILKISSEIKEETKARGIKVSVFYIYHEKIIILSLRPNINGWSAQNIEKLNEELKKV